MTDRQPSRFTLRVLGGFQLSRSGVAVDVPTRKIACLLTYLACTAPLPQSREKLANLFWGAYGEDRARHNLRQALARLRALLGQDAIVSSGEALRLAPGAFDCDVARFEALLAEGGAASLAAAVDLYGGALLEDISVGDATWNDWLLRERDRLSERAISAMVAKGEISLAAGDAERAMQCGRRAIDIDNFREDGHRLVLRALAAAGRNAEALRRYQDLAALLRAELDAEPDTETRRLAEALARGRSGEDDATSGGIAASPDPPAAAAPDADPGRGAVWRDGAERRQMTVFVCNAEPVASPLGAMDPEDLRDFIQAFRETAAQTVAAFGGVVVAGAGSSVQALFGYPEARERDAVQAVRAGMALVQAVQSLPVAQIPARASVGIAAGLVVVEEEPAKGVVPVVIGEASTLAPQLLAAAGPGQIAVSDETRPLLAAWFKLRPSDSVVRGPARLPDAWLVCGEADEAGGAEVDLRKRLVGRQEEVDLLLRRWDQVRQGEGRVVLLSGEPGIGKSSLAEELAAVLDADLPALLRFDCSPHHALRPLHPYIIHLERRAGLYSAAEPAEKLDRIAAIVGPISTDAPRDVALLAELLGLPADPRYPPRSESPQQKRDLIMTAFLRMLEEDAAQQPLVMLFEDIHWIDPTSLDLLDRTIARLADLPVLLMVTFRPEHQPAWIGQSHVTLLHLNRLGRRDSAAIIGDVARDRPLPPPIVEKIIDRAEGVPLFVAELSKHVIERAVVDEAAEAASPPPRRTMPATLQAALSVRFEGLGGARMLALIGSAIGRQFSHELICAIIEGEVPDLDADLDRLRASGLLARRGTPPNATYAFTHALGRDAAYGLILKGRKRRLHSRIADVLRDRFSAEPEGLPESVAHHLFQAGRVGEAADFWTKAGRAAQARWANRECAEFFDLALRALNQLARTPASLRQTIDLRFEMKNALTPLGEFERILDHLREARLLIDELGDLQRLCQFQVHMCQILGFDGRSKEAITCGQDAVRLARSLGDTRLRVEATIFLATAYFATMDYRQAERLFLDVLSLLEGMPRGERFALAGSPEITARIFLAGVNTVRGEFERALQYAETALQQAEALEQPYSLGVSLWCLADLHLTRGHVAQAIDLLERGLAVSRQWDLPFMVAAHSAYLGYAYSLTQRADEGLALLEQAVRVFGQMRHQLALSLFSVPLADAYVLGGQLDQAGAFAREAL